MPSSGTLHRVVVVRDYFSEEFTTSIIKMERIGELGTTLAVTSNIVHSSSSLFTLMMQVICSSETSIFIRATLRNIQEDCIHHS
jgi:hypothetical protein